MDWMIGRHYRFCNRSGDVEYEGKILNISDLAIEISTANSKMTIPLTILSQLAAIEVNLPPAPSPDKSKGAEIEMEATDFPLLLTEQEVAHLIGMSRSFLRQSRMDGQRKNRTDAPPFIRIGRAIRYKAEDVREWIATHQRCNSTIDT